MTETIAEANARIAELQAEIAGYQSQTFPPPAPPAPRVADRAATDTFDPASVLESTRPDAGRSTAWRDAGREEFPEPAAPILPPPGAVVPADLTDAYREHETARQAWLDAVDAVNDFRADAQVSRRTREAAIRAAARAVAQGKPRPEIPDAVTPEAEDVEVRILSGVVADRASKIAAATRKANAVVYSHAEEWADLVVSQAPAADDALRDALQVAQNAAARAEGLRGMAAAWRAMATAHHLRQRGERVSEWQIERLTSSLMEATTSHMYRAAKSQHRGVWSLLSQAQEAAGTLRGCDPAALPHLDTVGSSGGSAFQVLDYLVRRAPQAAIETARRLGRIPRGW